MIGAVRRGCQRAFYSFCKSLSLASAALIFETRVYGGARVPRRGACLIAATHQSYLDPWIVGMSVPRRCAFLARHSLFRVPLLGRLIRVLGAVPIPRGSAASRGALDTGIRLLRDEEALLVFPEGTRSADGFLQPFKRGVALMARRTGAPVVPVLVVGTHALWPRGRRFPLLSFPWITLPRRFHRRGDGRDRGREAYGPTARRAAIRIFFGEPIAFGEDEDLDIFTSRLRAACEELARHAGVPEICGSPQPESEVLKLEAICEERMVRSWSSSCRKAAGVSLPC